MRDARQTVLQALPILIANPLLRWEQLLAALVRAGLPHSTAVEVAVFVPIAFGRALMASKFIAVLHSGYFRNGEQGEHALREVPLYVAAHDLAWELFLAGNQLTYQQFIAVAGRSAELNQVDRMLDQGRKFSDIMLGPVIIPWPKVDGDDAEPIVAEIIE